MGTVRQCSTFAEGEGGWPTGWRRLYLDIEGPRNEQGGYDRDRLELQQDVILGFLLPFVSAVHIPLGLHVENPHPQQDDVPGELVIQPPAER